MQNQEHCQRVKHVVQPRPQPKSYSQQQRVMGNAISPLSGEASHKKRAAHQYSSLHIFDANVAPDIFKRWDLNDSVSRRYFDLSPHYG